MGKLQLHVGIIGAGLGGLAAAIGIARAGHKVTILEQAPQLGEVGAGIQIPPNSTRILARWDILPAIEKVSVRPNNVIMRSYRDGKVLSSQPLIPICEDVYGYPYLHIHRADYHKIMVEEARKLGVDIQLDSFVTGIDFERPAVHVKNRKDPFLCDLIIGADGLKSVCREALLGHPDPPHLTGDLAYRITVPAEDMKKHPLLADLVAVPNINFWLGPSSHVVCYLLKGGNLYNIVIACPDNLPKFVNQQKADLEEMHAIFKEWDPKLRALLELCHDTSKWRLQNSREMMSWSHPSGRFTLLGDACHATLPYLAQGAAQAVEDAAVLAHLFEKVEHAHQVPDLLTIYETIRKPRATAVVAGSSYAGQKIYHLHDGPRQKERDRQMLAFQDKPFEGYQNRWRDPVFQKFLFSYDAQKVVDDAWKVYQEGRFVGTIGQFGVDGVGEAGEREVHELRRNEKARSPRESRL
ncbi:salicylate hydroxylase [Exophiala viscosa]|uniref:salicylate hydroxylase n=1 Tax=Exophiala viscosa TaxID=2486360 RepID=UPI00218E1A90|nr:salicylate hydroxylase [Exophiala viscosa]